MATDKRPPIRLDADAEDAGRGLGQLVVALLEIVRQLMERQALRRVDSGDLDAGQIERLGRALRELDRKFAELRDLFGISADDRFVHDIEDAIGKTSPPTKGR